MKKVSLKKGVSLKKKPIAPNKEHADAIVDSIVSIPISTERKVSEHSAEYGSASDGSKESCLNDGDKNESDTSLKDESGIFLRTFDGLKESDLDSLDRTDENESDRFLKNESGIFLRTLDGLESVLCESDETDPDVEEDELSDNPKQEIDFWSDASDKPRHTEKRPKSSKSTRWIGVSLLLLVVPILFFGSKSANRIWLRSNLGFHSEVDLVCVQPKTFEIQRQNQFDENVSFNVSLSPFAISKTEVTRKLWLEVMGYKPWQRTACREGYSTQKNDQLPTTCISWYEAIVFTNALSIKNDLTPYYYFTFDNAGDAEEELSWQEKVQRLNHSSIKRTSGGNGYRLPTDLEWEYAAKADGSSLYAGGSTLDTVAWYVENSGNKSELKPVGEKQSNGFGLFDMSGGVYEWVWDWEADYPMDSQELINPTGVLNRSNEKIVRGGSVFSKREALEISEYETQFPDTIDFVTGFRVVQNECQIKSP